MEKKKRGYNILTDYRPTGNKIIDQVALVIMQYRKRKIALQAIHLAPLYYDWFRKGVEILQGRPLQDDQGLAMDGVNIEKGSRFQTKPMLAELWPVSKPVES